MKWKRTPKCPLMVLLTMVFVLGMVPWAPGIEAGTTDSGLPGQFEDGPPIIDGKGGGGDGDHGGPLDADPDAFEIDKKDSPDVRRTPAPHNPWRHLLRWLSMSWGLWTVVYFLN